MGVSLGGSYGSSQSASTGSDTTAKTYAAPQTGVQNDLGTSLSKSLAAKDEGTLDPGVLAQKTQSADAINTQSSGLQDRLTRFLAQRGFGKSGESGKAVLSTELGRQAALGNNEANFANVQQTANGSNLMAALNYAFTSMGTNETGTSSGTSSGYKVGGGVSAGIPGMG